MAYTIADLNQVVLDITDKSYEDEAWEEFRYRLLSSEAVKTPLGYAMLQDQQEAEADSFGEYSDDVIWFVFSIDDRDGTRYFKKTGYMDSYDGRAFDGATIEVEQGRVITVEWKAVQR